LIVVLNDAFELLAAANKCLPLINSLLQFTLNWYSFMCEMFIIFGFALHAEKLFFVVFALCYVAEVHSDVISGTEALHIEILSPCVES